MNDFLFDEDEIEEDQNNFDQDAEQSLRPLIVNFENRENMKAFSELIGQRVTTRTSEIWWPEITFEELREL